MNHREQNIREEKHAEDAEEKHDTVQRSIYQNARSVATLAAKVSPVLNRLVV